MSKKPLTEVVYTTGRSLLPDTWTFQLCEHTDALFSFTPALRDS
jgi:hypothetical protein